jgi:hypothetical protein
MWLFYAQNSAFTILPYRNISMNSNTQIQNTLNNPPLQPYSPNLNQSTQQVEVGTRTKRDRPNKQPRKTKALVANVLPIPNR